MKTISNKAVWIVLIGILVFAFLIRVIWLGKVPPGVNRDEAALGYTAYSLLKTAKDEHGKFLPISLKSFGDWKLPIYAYASIPWIAIFGLNEFSTRFLSVLSGVGTIFLTYLLGYRLFRQKSLPLIAATLLAITPWHIFFSRVASEANVAVFLTAISVWLFFVSFEKRILLPLSMFILSLTLLTYHGNHVFAPLLLLLLLIFYGKQFKSKIGLVSILLFVISSGWIFSHTLLSADKTKISGLLSLNDPSIIHSQIEQNRLIYGNSLLGKVMSNRVVFFAEQFTQNYLKSFSPEFLFIKGGNNNQHNIPDFGNLYPVEAAFIVLGIYYLFAKKEKHALLLLGWVLISTIGAALTKDAPHSARQFAIFPALTLVSAYGMYTSVCLIFNKNVKSIIMVGLSMIYIGSFLLFTSRYFVLFPYKSYVHWGDAYQEMVEKVARYKNEYENVYISRPDYSPYIYYLFYNQSNPITVQDRLIHYPETAEGFAHVESFDGITYKKNDWTTELIIPDQLYVDWVEGIPSGATQSAILITKKELDGLRKAGIKTDLVIGDAVVSQIRDQVLLPNGSPLFYFIETKKASPSADVIP